MFDQCGEQLQVPVVGIHHEQKVVHRHHFFSDADRKVPSGDKDWRVDIPAFAFEGADELREVVITWDNISRQ